VELWREAEFCTLVRIRTVMEETTTPDSPWGCYILQAFCRTNFRSRWQIYNIGILFTAMHIEVNKVHWNRPFWKQWPKDINDTNAWQRIKSIIFSKWIQLQVRRNAEIVSMSFDTFRVMVIQFRSTMTKTKNATKLSRNHFEIRTIYWRPRLIVPQKSKCTNLSEIFCLEMSFSTICWLDCCRSLLTFFSGNKLFLIAGGFFCRGSIQSYMIWPRLLSSWEISNLAKKCECPRGFVISMSLDQVSVVGNITSVTGNCRIAWNMEENGWWTWKKTLNAPSK